MMRFVPPSVGLALAVAIGACSTAPSDARIGIDDVVDGGSLRSDFDPVSDLLDYRCGSLDCHGNAQRNLVIWGCYGLRLEPLDASSPDGGPVLVPGCRSSGGINTSGGEYDATYRSLLGLEPTVMSVVVSGGGQHPELLTFVRKARGWDAHKGGQIWTAGDPSDSCITSWLAGATSTADCAAGLLCDSVECNASVDGAAP